MDEAVYHIRNLVHAYRDQPILEIGEFTVRPAEIIGIIGPNGSGKSTLLKLLGFIEKPTAGEIRFRGKPAEPFFEHVRFRVTLLTQEPYLMKRSVYRNIAYGLHLRGRTEGMRDRVYDALRWVGLSGEDFAHRRWYELSGGEAQRVAMAARLVLEPEVLLMDEPTASVDAASAHLIKDAALRARQQWGTTLIIASHDWPWLYEICDDVRHLFRGQFFASGEENVIFGPWHPRPDGLWEKRLTDGQTVRVTEPPGPGAAAVFPAERMRLLTGPAGKPTRENRLAATVSRLIHERRSGAIVVTVLADNLPITVKMHRKDFSRARLYPGMDVTICFEPADPKWSP